MLSIGNKKYRNLQEQVGYNTECIKNLDEYLDGIKVEDKLVVIESDSGTFTDEELVTLSGPLAFISNGSRVWMKDSETLVEFVYKAIDIKADEVGSVYYNIGGSKIVVNRETGAYNTSSDTVITTYSKNQIDSIISNIDAIKADRAELTLKANVSGQAFTGGITAPSIIEDMSGYGYTPITKENANITYTYVGSVKNGNKLTFACSGYFSRSGDLAGGNCALVRFTFPQAIGVKLNQTEISGVSGLAFGKIDFCKNYANHVDVPIVVFKESNSQIAVTMYNLTATYNIEINTPYLFRFEITFLLSDNLAS